MWRWASTNDGGDPEIILTGCGASLTVEVLAAADLLRQEAPSWRVRVVNVSDLLALGTPEKHPRGLEEQRFQRLLPFGCPFIYNFHGFTAAIKQLL